MGGRPRTLTPDQAQRIAAMCKRGESHAKIAKAVGVSLPLVSRISCGRAYSDVTGIQKGSSPRGARRRLTALQAQEVVETCRRGIPRSTVAKIFDVERTIVDRIITGRGYSDATGIQNSPTPCGCSDCMKSDVGAKNLKRIHSLRGTVSCVSCHARLRRVAGEVQKANGVIYCTTCKPVGAQG